MLWNLRCWTSELANNALMVRCGRKLKGNTALEKQTYQPATHPCFINTECFFFQASGEALPGLPPSVEREVGPLQGSGDQREVLT